MKTKFNGLLTLILALLVQISFAQEKTVTGKVSDASGPLPGVTVIVKGTNTGTQTDFDGNYSINAATGAVLQYSYLGMQNIDKTVGTSNVINVVMTESAQALEEVVVTAVGISRNEKELGYNVQSVAAEDINTRPNADIVNSLAGATSGVQIVSSAGDAGASTFITIRGSASITGNNQPLFIVNGMPIISGGGSSGTEGVNTSSRSIDINPDDIESITVLKGPEGAALYGVEAGNGAIVITTKKAKAQKLKVSYDNNFRWEQITPI